MTADGRPEQIDALLAQHAWVRALARTLVRDDADADDLAQDAWLAALRTPPTGRGAVRGWFATVLRNGARQAHRGDVRRDRREAGAARPDGVPSALDVVARAEEHGTVVQAVLGLDEPFRTAVLLRFFDELPPREIALRTGVPVETARSRVQRGLAKVREKLDAAHGGDGAAWKAALLPLASLPDFVFSGAAAGETALAGSSGAGSGTASALTTGAMAMGKAATAAVGVLALAAGAGIVWFGGAEGREELTKLRGDVEQARAAIAVSKADAKKAEDAVRHRDSRIAELERERAEATKARDESVSRASKLADELESAQAQIAKFAPASAETKPGGPTFAFDEFGDALTTVDWKSIGVHTTAIVGPIREIADAIVGGTPVPLKAAGEAQRHNGPLIQAVSSIQGKLTGTGVNGAYTHPAFMVNALASALAEIGKPLSPAQRTSLADIGRRFTEEERRRVAAYTDTTFAIHKLVEEGALKDRFFNALRAALTPEQLDAVSPASVRDRLSADLWSEGLLWSTVTMRVSTANRETFLETAQRRLGSALRLDDAQKAKVPGIVGDWLGRLPAALADWKPDALSRSGMEPADIVAVAAAETKRLIERLATDLTLSGPSLDAARSWGAVVLPVPGAGGDDDDE